MLSMGSRYLSLLDFRREVTRSKICSQSPVAVALSGGSDSLALLWLTRQVFSKVVGITVDHGLRSTSASEAVRTGKLATALGVEHHIVNIDWQGNIPSRKIQTAARLKRYTALLEFCEKYNLRTLMTGHHLDDQIETFIMRLSRGSGIDGLAGTYLRSCYSTYPDVQIVRPLLNCRKKRLQELCREKKMEWVEDPTNVSLDYSRNYIRHILSHDSQLVRDLQQVHLTLSNVRRDLSRQVFDTVTRISRLNTKYGYMTFNRTELLKMELPKPVLRRAIGAIFKFVSGDNSPIPYLALDTLISQLPTLKGKTMLHKCLLYPTKETEILAVCKAQLTHNSWCQEPVKVGEKLHWMKSWEIELFPTTGAVNHNDKQYFVRGLDNETIALGRKCGIRVSRSNKDPPVNVRPSLPVITDEEGTVILIPHIKYVDRTRGLTARVKFKPLLSFDSIINPYHSTIDSFKTDA